MHIKFVEIQNFRKLKSIRIDFAKETTVFVGANNSGKTSAMVALGHFLIDQNRFSTNDFTLSNWVHINKLGAKWEELASSPEAPELSLSEWVEFLPSLDLWIDVSADKIHYVSHLIPTLQWKGGNLGVRLRLQPKDLSDLFKEYTQARKAARDTVDAAKKTKNSEDIYTLSLWPTSMGEFLGRKINSHFIVRAYTLDPAQNELPINGVARPQQLPLEKDYLEGNPFRGLIRIDEINAQRGFSDASFQSRASSSSDETSEKSNTRKLSDQLRSYYTKHIDPSEMPEASDVDALQAIHNAQTLFDEKLKTSFETALDEMGDLGYPGFTDLELVISTKIHPMDGLNHPSALQYKVSSPQDQEELVKNSPCLPEQYNGLGYQNLISMVFRLMSFRDHWMKVGKSGKRPSISDDADFIPPLHLVLVEEPEAHLHVQVQQVFIRKAYKILRRHIDLGDKTSLTTQLIVSTHSSHIAHECEFGWLRYFRRRPAVKPAEVPISTVVNLSEVFGSGLDTEKFVTRYLRSTHCDLFFADAAILVEGPAERILVPNFIRENFSDLNKSYITLLEISGSHAHRLRSLIEHIGLITLIITDLDSMKILSDGKLKSSPPKRNEHLVTNNFTLRSWIPKEKSIDLLLDLKAEEKTKLIDEFSSIRVAYQCPIKLSASNVEGGTNEALANTFEDAFIFDNLSNFLSLKGRTGLMKKFKKAISTKAIPHELSLEMFEYLQNGDKAQFALDLLYQDPRSLKTPEYIREGLSWLESQLKKKQLETITENKNVIAAIEETIV